MNLRLNIGNQLADCKIFLPGVNHNRKIQLLLTQEVFKKYSYFALHKSS